MNTKTINTEDAPVYCSVSNSAGSVSSDDSVIRHALRILESRMREAGPRITDADTAKNLFRLRIGGGEREVMSVAYLDNQHRVIEIKDEALGTVSRASVYPREIAKSALLLNASAVILSHNHPSGSLVPSQADRTLTTAIKDCLFMFDIQVLDHIIVTHEGSFSFASNNLI